MAWRSRSGADNCQTGLWQPATSSEPYRLCRLDVDNDNSVNSEALLRCRLQRREELRLLLRPRCFRCCGQLLARPTLPLPLLSTHLFLLAAPVPSRRSLQGRWKAGSTLFPSSSRSWSLLLTMGRKESLPLTRLYGRKAWGRSQAPVTPLFKAGDSRDIECDLHAARPATRRSRNCHRAKMQGSRVIWRDELG